MWRGSANCLLLLVVAADWRSDDAAVDGGVGAASAILVGESGRVVEPVGRRWSDLAVRWWWRR